MKQSFVIGLFIALLAPGCGDETGAASGGNSSAGSSGGTGGGSADAGSDAGYQCGIGPGTTGNSKGVGKYCDTLGDCSGQDASLCATLGDPTAHFCTLVCDAAMPAEPQCGEMATCECNGGSSCGCTPAACTQ
jgi:hypothetical protein